MKRLVLTAIIAASITALGNSAVLAAGSTHKEEAKPAAGSTAKDHGGHDMAHDGEHKADHAMGSDTKQDMDHDSQGHAGSTSKSMPAASTQAGYEPSGGQAAFTEIERIIAKLEADPSTDWSKVNIAGLRLHLIDMDNVVMRADVKTQKTDSGAIYTVTSDDPAVVSSIQAMTDAHGMMVSGQGYDWETTMLANGAEVSITSDDAGMITKIQALGFVGLLVAGGHHNFHHEMMASGNNPH